MVKTPLKDIVIVLPGIIGSVLQREGTDVWAPSVPAVRDALTRASLSSLSLTPISETGSVESEDGIRATALIHSPQVVAGLFKSFGYTATRRYITSYFDVKDGGVGERLGNYYEFPYDWRRDNRHSALQLKTLVDRRLPEWRKDTGYTDAKVILLAHSMGGLVSRYYTEVLEGWRDCRALITLGTPFRGSVKTADYLSNGYKGIIGGLIGGLADVMRSFPSVYQLLPIYPMLEVGGRYLCIAEVSDIPGISRERAEQGLRFHREIESAVERNRQDQGYQDGFRTIPVVGSRQPTLQSGVLIDGRLLVSRSVPTSIDSLLEDGDETVPRLSAIPIELSNASRELIIPERHAALPAHPGLFDSLCEWIKQRQIRGLEAIRGPRLLTGQLGIAALSLYLDDLYLTDEAILIQAEILDSPDDYGAPVGKIESVGSAEDPKVGVFRRSEKTWVWDVGHMKPGIYRLDVKTSKSGPGSPSPVHDVFQVISL